MSRQFQSSLIMENFIVKENKINGEDFSVNNKVNNSTYLRFGGRTQMLECTLILSCFSTV